MKSSGIVKPYLSVLIGELFGVSIFLFFNLLFESYCPIVLFFELFVAIIITVLKKYYAREHLPIKHKVEYICFVAVVVFCYFFILLFFTFLFYCCCCFVFIFLWGSTYVFLGMKEIESVLSL